MAVKFLTPCRLAALILLISAPAARAETKPFVIVSDVDDTAKITNVLNHKNAVVNGITGMTPFAGIPELYRQLAQSSIDAGLKDLVPLIFLSGSPDLVELSVELFIKENGFPKSRLVIKDSKELVTELKNHEFLKADATEKYKEIRLEALVKEMDTPFLLLGDDTELDPLALTRFATAHPDHSLQIYIHKVTGREIAESVTTYYTAFEVALSEVEAERLTPAQAVEVGKVIVSDATKPETVFPAFAECPKVLTYDPKYKNSDPALIDMKQKVQARVQTICAQR